MSRSHTHRFICAALLAPLITIGDSAAAKTETQPVEAKTSFIHTAVIESEILLAAQNSTIIKTESESTPSAPSFVSRKAEAVGIPQESALVPWPFLLVSAMAGLLLWMSQRRKPTPDNRL